MKVTRQSSQPLYPDVMWSRPETKHGAGKLLIIGGQAHEFVGVADAYQAAESAGAGIVRVLMPESTRKITRMLPNIEYAASNQSGSFSRDARLEIEEAAAWSDAVLLAGDLGRNSETSLLLDDFVRDRRQALVLTKDALASLGSPIENLGPHAYTTIVTDFSDVQKLATRVGLEQAIVSTMTLDELTLALETLSTIQPMCMVMQNGLDVWCAYRGAVVLTPLPQHLSITSIAATIAVWQLQQPEKFFESAVSAIFCLTKPVS